MLKRGLAKAVFTEAYQRSPWLPFSNEHEQILSPNWPFLDLLLSQQRLTYLDYALTHRLLRQYPEIGQEVALFICHLTLAAKEGHLCVRISSEGINPSVAQLWKDQEGHAVSLEEARTLTQLILEGAKRIPSRLITVFTRQGTAIPCTPLCCEGNDFYLQRHWIFETLFLKSLKKHRTTQPTLALDELKVKQTVEQLCQEKVLLSEQAQAIIQGCTHGLTLVTGGPGTGKTYTAGQFIKVFWQHLSLEQRENCQIALAAPTGKAAANLQRSLSQVVADLENFHPIQAKTLHALLGIKQSFSHTEQVRLSADLIIVDESSMIDVRMMSRLFEALKEGSRLMLLGDQHQLPSVESGSIFADLIHLQTSDPHLAIPCTQLTVCLRAELNSLIDFARLVNEGKGQEVLAHLNQSNGTGIKRLQLAVDKKEAQRQFLAHVLGHFPTVVKKDQDPERLLELFNTIRILSPMRKGPFGFESLNQLIWQHICQKVSKGDWLAIPIMVVTNDYRQDLFNGETGVLLRRLPLQSIGVEDYAIFPSRLSSGDVRRLPALLLPKYEYAYCLSVHKSQGSEFDHVILVLPEGAELFGREVFYTAVTRARKQIEVCGTDHIILKTVMQQGMRLSGIEQRLTTKEWIEE
jgi:exodeoxyribonuclease V alpha subunit